MCVCVCVCVCNFPIKEICPCLFSGAGNLFLPLVSFFGYCSISGAVTNHETCLCSQLPVTWHAKYAAIFIGTLSQVRQKLVSQEAPQKTKMLHTCSTLLFPRSQDFISSELLHTLQEQGGAGPGKVQQMFPIHTSVPTLLGFEHLESWYLLTGFLDFSQRQFVHILLSAFLWGNEAWGFSFYYFPDITPI